MPRTRMPANLIRRGFQRDDYLCHFCDGDSFRLYFKHAEMAGRDYLPCGVVFFDRPAFLRHKSFILEHGIFRCPFDVRIFLLGQREIFIKEP